MRLAVLRFPLKSVPLQSAIFVLFFFFCDSTSVSWLNGGEQIGHSSLSSVVHTWLLLWELLHLDRFPIGIGRYLAVWTRYWVTLHVVILEH